MANLFKGESFHIDWRAVEVNAEIRAALWNILFESAESIAGRARAVTPPKDITFAHERSIRAERGVKKSNFTMPKAHVVGDEITGPLEWGTTHHAPFPHIYPSLDAEKPAIKDRLEAVFGRGPAL